ncbi:MAG: rod shape-determining protein [Acidobacteria bacterium]|nr:rod shape-determining protein [Acidobacteriota bacterium]
MNVEQIKSALIILRVGKAATEVVAQINGDTIYSRQFAVGTQTMDVAVVEHFQRKLNMLIGNYTAEAIRIAVGSAFPEDSELAIQVRGRDVDAQMPRTVTVTEAEISAAISNVVETLVNAVKVAVQRVSSEARAALAAFGAIELTGEGACLRGLDKRLMFATDLLVVIPD